MNRGSVRRPPACQPAVPDRPLHPLALPAPEAAPALLGMRLRCRDLVATIAEVEAYQGEDDLACHASKGRTKRTTTLYAAPGTLYVYRCYGIHDLLNLVCDREGVPAAVLIRGILIDGMEPGRSNGPGKVAARLGLTTAGHNGLALGDPRCPLVLLPPTGAVGAIRRGPRVGVDYAGPVWAAMPWRWWLAGFPVAKPPAGQR